MKKSLVLGRISNLISRIDSGSFNDSDIFMLIVTMRELPKANKNIFEIGSFVAHSNERDRGHIRDVMLRNHYAMSCLYGKDKAKMDFSQNRFPLYLPEFIELQVKSNDPSSFSKSLGITEGQLKSSVQKLCNKSTIAIVDDSCQFQRDLSERERKILERCLTVVNCSDGLQFDELITDMCELMRLEDPSIDTQPLIDKKREILCGIVCLMNNTTYLLSKKYNIRAKVVASWGRRYDKPFADDESTHSKSYVIVNGVYDIVVEFEGKDENLPIRSPVFLSSYENTEVFSSEVTHENIEGGNINFSIQKGMIVKV